jgi:hypothetical protein
MFITLNTGHREAEEAARLRKGPHPLGHHRRKGEQRSRVKFKGQLHNPTDCVVRHKFHR